MISSENVVSWLYATKWVRVKNVVLDSANHRFLAFLCFKAYYTKIKKSSSNYLH